MQSVAKKLKNKIKVAKSVYNAKFENNFCLEYAKHLIISSITKSILVQSIVKLK